MKKKFFLLSLPLSVLLLTACSGSEDINVNKMEYDFHNTTTEYDIKANKLSTYYINDSTIEYVDIKEFIASLNGFFDASTYGFDKVPFSSIYTVYWTNGSYRFRVQFDYNADTISFNSPNVFSNVVSTSDTNFTYGIVEDTSSIKASGGGETYWELSDYFDFHYKSDSLYIPLSVANTLFCSINYYNLYFTGSEYYGYYESYDTNNSQTLTTDDKLLNKEHREHNYNLIRFIMNKVYGLKEFNKVDDYSSILANYKEEMLSTNREVYSNAYQKFFMTYLDDPHTSYIYDSSFNRLRYADYPDFKENGRWKTQIDGGKELKNLKTAANITSNVSYNNHLAVIHFDTFLTGNKNDIFDENNNVKSTAKEKDSYYFMKSCIEEISNHTEVTDIMLDLTLSPGGNLAAMLRVIGGMTNKDIIFTNYSYYSQMYASESIKIDNNLNGNTTDDDHYNYNWGVLVSSSTYSAANYLAAIAKNQKICKVFGEKSGGGMCAVMPLVLSDNSTVYISGQQALVIDSGNNNYSFPEAGVTPDVEIARNDFYNIEKLSQVFTI